MYIRAYALQKGDTFVYNDRKLLCVEGSLRDGDVTATFTKKGEVKIAVPRMSIVEVISSVFPSRDEMVKDVIKPKDKK